MTPFMGAEGLLGLSKLCDRTGEFVFFEFSISFSFFFGGTGV
jgi:hypothetical protein